MSIMLRIQIEDGAGLLEGLKKEIKKAGINTIPVNLSSRDGVALTDIIISLGSAGVFTALYQIICKFLEKDKNREITIEREGLKLNIKSHKLLEEKELLRMIAPDLIEQQTEIIKKNKNEK